MHSTASAGVVRLRSAVAARARVAATFLLCSLVGVAAAQDLKWVARGPAPTTKGQVENVKDGEVVGAVNAVTPHPTDKDVVYIGAVNGGIWKTANTTAASPTWEHQTDALGSLSIGALEFDPTDATHKTLVAGAGRFSSLGGRGGRTGLLRTTDGVKWDPLDGGGDLKGLNVSGVAPRGSVIVLGANAADATGKAGVWRSTDTGAKWKQVSGGAKTGLPAGPAACLAGDPANPKRSFTNAASARPVPEPRRRRDVGEGRQSRAEQSDRFGRECEGRGREARQRLRRGRRLRRTRWRVPVRQRWYRLGRDGLAEERGREHPPRRAGRHPPVVGCRPRR